MPEGTPAAQDIFQDCTPAPFAFPLPCLQIAMRISFANFIFYILHAILMFNLRYQEDPRLDIQCSGWLLKLCIWAGLLVGFFYVPSSAVQG